jgi:hypothetical protein
MAEHLSLEQLEALPVTPYMTARAELRSGDLLFASGRYPFSQLIRTLTRSPWSHVGVIFALPSIDRVLLLESVESVGVRFAPLSKYVEDYDNRGAPYHGLLAIARPRGITESVVRDVARFGTDQLARPYDRDEIAVIAARAVLGLGPGQEGSRGYLCSELVHACFAAAGYHFVGDPRGFVSPENIWADERIELVARIQ